MTSQASGNLVRAFAPVRAEIAKAKRDEFVFAAVVDGTVRARRIAFDRIDEELGSSLPSSLDPRRDLRTEVGRAIASQPDWGAISWTERWVLFIAPNAKYGTVAMKVSATNAVAR